MLRLSDEELGASGLFEEGDGVVLEVEEGREAAEEDVADNNVVEAGRSGHAHDAHEALNIAELLDLQNVILGSEVVHMAVDFEGEGGEILDARAVAGDFTDGGDERVEDLCGSYDEGSSRVDCSLETGGGNGRAIDVEVVELEVPVGLLDDVVLHDFRVAF